MEDKKWKLVEKVVAAAFDEPNVTVQRNVRLRSLRRKGGNGGLREIDVLITGELIGQKVNFAIECKDYKRKVDSHHIDAFIGKLYDVGLATQTSIFVTTRGYTTQAIERAHEVGMKALVLRHGEEADGKIKILHAIQSHIFLLCSVAEIEFKTEDTIDFTTLEHFKFFDKNGVFIGLLPDFMWESWIRELPPPHLGKYSYKLKINDDFNYLENGQKNTVEYIRVECQISALVLQFTGEANQVHLVNAHEGKTERYRLNADFSSSTPTHFHFQDEDTLQKFLNQQGVIAKIEFPRLKLPKIVMNQGLLWSIPIRVSDYLRSNTITNIEQEIQKLAESTDNNFWEFDAIYSKIMEDIDKFENVRFEVYPLQEEYNKQPSA